jgi:trehalose/maltose hydrolase-like predicted phosphorylase
VGVINYEITSLNKDSKIVYKPYIDAGVSNEDANWEEKFWEPLDVKNQEMKLCNGSNLQNAFQGDHFHAQ